MGGAGRGVGSHSQSMNGTWQPGQGSPFVAQYSQRKSSPRLRSNTVVVGGRQAQSWQDEAVTTPSPETR